MCNKTFLNFLVNLEKHIDTILKNLVDSSSSISEEMYKSIKPVAIRQGILRRLC